MFYDVKDPGAFCYDVFKVLNKNGIWLLELSLFTTYVKKSNIRSDLSHEHIAFIILFQVSKKLLIKMV